MVLGLWWGFYKPAQKAMTRLDGPLEASSSSLPHPSPERADLSERFFPALPPVIANLRNHSTI